jgi:DNA primase
MISHSKLDIAKEEIKARLSIRQVVEHLTGQSFVRGAIRCPFHNEKTGSFRLIGNNYKCFGCGEYGDVFSFVMKYNGLSFPDAIKWLDSEFHLGLLNQRVTARQQAEARKRKREQEKKLIEEQRKRLEYDQICLDYRICNEALRKNVLEPFSDTWCYYIDLQTALEQQLWKGGHYGS